MSLEPQQDPWPMLSPSAPETDRDEYSITELRRRFQVTARALYHYEEKGLLKPHRRDECRYYSRRDFRRLEVIVSSRKANLGLREIEELLGLYESDGGAEAQLLRGLELLERRLRDMEEEREQITRLASVLEQRLRQTAGRSACA
jgi:DNA-binding transcriptional MerR regulator